jgi:drug/metabolite transporter (DMT)-like permease
MAVSNHINTPADDIPADLHTERLLLVLGGLFILLNFTALTILHPDQWLGNGVAVAAWVVCASGSHMLLNRRLPDRDQSLLPIVMFMSGWGLVIIDRLAPRFADRQVIWLAVSTSAMLIVAILPQTLRWLREYRYLLLVGGLALSAP